MRAATARLTAVNFYAGGPLNRASWLRNSAAFLNRAVQSAEARFLLLSDGDPLVWRGGEPCRRVAFVPWDRVAGSVQQSVHAVSAVRGADVFGADAYGLRARADAEPKHWARATESIVSPLLSLAFLGIKEREGAASSVEPVGTPYFALALRADTPTAALKAELVDGGEAPCEVLDMRSVVLTGALDEADAPFVAYARTLLDWNERHRFCPACAQRQYSVWAGHKRSCAGSLAALAEPHPVLEHLGARPGVCASLRSVQNYTYPRSDPVIIVGILSADGERILLGRQKAWPTGCYSCIACVATEWGGS